MVGFGRTELSLSLSCTEFRALSHGHGFRGPCFNGVRKSWVFHDFLDRVFGSLRNKIGKRWKINGKVKQKQWKTNGKRRKREGVGPHGARDHYAQHLSPPLTAYQCAPTAACVVDSLVDVVYKS